MGAQNVNGRSQNETDGFHAEVSHALHTGRRWVSGLHCDWRWNMGFSPHSWNQATVPPEPKNSKLQFQWKNSWCPFSCTEKTFSGLTSCLLVQQLMPLLIVTPWHGFDEPFKTKERNAFTRRVPAPRQRAAPVQGRHHCASGKNQVGYIGLSAVQSGLRAQRFSLVSSPKETSCWEKVRRRWWWGARKRHDVVQSAGGRLLWLGDTEAGSKI